MSLLSDSMRRLGNGMFLFTSWVSLGIWVAFFSRCQRSLSTGAVLSVLNEVQHEHFYEGLGVPAAKAYTRCYDAIVSESRKVYPALEFVGPELGPIKWDKEHTTDFLGYFLDPHNHADGKAPNQISFHCKIDADAFIDLIGLACRLANLNRFQYRLLQTA